MSTPLEKQMIASADRIRRLRPMFGTFCAVEITGAATHAERAIARAFDVMAEVECRMHPTRAESDPAKIATTLNQRIPISEATWQVLALAKQIWKLSNGIFDPCLLDQPGQLSDVELLENSTVICRAPIAIDLGGIAKGFAVDRAIEALQREGCTGGIVNAGGDVRVFGMETQELFLRASDRKPLKVVLQNAALAATDVNAVDAPSEHRGYYTRLSGRTFVRQHVAVTASHAAIADALTKCALFCSDDELSTLMCHFNATLLAW